MVYPLKIVIFHSYVKLPAGILLMLHWDSADSECESAQQCSADQSGRFVLASVPKPALQCDAAKCSVTLRAVLTTKDLGI